MRLLGPLSHPHIVRAEHAGTSPRGLFLAMELVDGWNLAEFVELKRPLRVVIACELIRQAAEGLEYIHEQEGVHRDLKPQNLMLDRAGVVKILDLGLGKWRDDATGKNDTRPGSTFGTLDYMSPEQFRDAKSVDIRADIYSLGCTFFYLLVGAPPFADPAHASLTAKMHAHLDLVPPSLAELRSDVPAEICDAIARTLAKSPDDRFQRPLELAEAVERFASRSAVLEMARTMDPTGSSTNPTKGRTRSRLNPDSGTLPESPTPPVPTRPVKRRAVLALAAASALGLAGGGGWWLVQSRSNSRAQLKQALTLQAGPCGGWWFDEIPQFNPLIRRLLLDSGATDLAALTSLMATKNHEDIAAKIQSLHQQSPRVFPPTSQSEIVTISLQQTSSTDFAKAADYLTKLQKIRDEIVQRTPQLAQERPELKGLPPEYVHFHAVVLHKIAFLSRGTERNAAFSEARQAYEGAIKLYSPEDDQGRLCLSDYARLLFDSGAREQASGKYAEARLGAKGAGTAPFRVYAACWGAESLYKQGQSTAALNALDEARRLLSDVDAASALGALVEEQSAWTYLERWSTADSQSQKAALDKAEECFKKALALREVQRESSTFAFVKWLHDRHGLALVEQYRGNNNGSKTIFVGIIGDIDQALHSGLLSPAARAELKFRRFNSLERMAECDLYATPPNLAAAVATYQQATGPEQAEGWDTSRYLLNLTRVHCKQAIAQALAGLAADTVASYGQAQDQAELLAADERELVKLLMQVTETLTGLASPDSKAVAAALHSLITALQSVPHPSLERDDRRLLEFLYEWCELDKASLDRL